MTIILFRIFASILLFISVLFMPWWTTIILALVCMIYFHYFIEAIFLFLLSDVLFALPESVFFDIVFVSSIFATITMFTIEIIKKKLKFYN